MPPTGRAAIRPCALSAKPQGCGMNGTARARSELARSGFSAGIMLAMLAVLVLLAPAIRADALARFTFTINTDPNFQPVNAEVSAFQGHLGVVGFTVPRPGDDNMFLVGTIFR